MFGWAWKIEFSGFAFHLTVKRSLWPGNYFTFPISLQTSSGPSYAQRERERERARPIHQKHQRVAPGTGEIALIVTAGSSSAPSSRSSPPKTNPPKTDLVLDPPKTELVHRAMPKAPASSSPPFFLVQTQPETQKTHSSNPLRRTHHSDKPIRQTHHSNEPIPQTHFSNPLLAAADLSLCHLSPSLTLRCFSDFFVLIFVSLIVYIFWFSIIIYIWMLRKCEKHDKNGFSRAFSETQPNTRKYFPKHFLKCNKTLENIFLSRKYFHLKLFYTRKIFYTETNAALTPKKSARGTLKQSYNFGRWGECIRDESLRRKSVIFHNNNSNNI